MKYLKKYNESNEIDRDELNSIIDPIRDDISDILVDFVGYDIKFIPANMFDSSVCFQLQILPKGYPLPSHKDIEPILVDSDILDDLRTVINVIELEIGFGYTDSYYYYNNFREEDIFKSGGKKVVTSISMFFTLIK